MNCQEKFLFLSTEDRETKNIVISTYKMEEKMTCRHLHGLYRKKSKLCIADVIFFRSFFPAWTIVLITF